MNEPPKDLYKFGPFLLDPAERLLLRENDPISLTPKAFEILLALVENSGHLLEKDQLIRRVWPDSFVEEANLTQNISTLRKALGESRDGIRYIETVPRRGYRFIVSVYKEEGTVTELIVKEHMKSQIVITEPYVAQTSPREDTSVVTKVAALQAVMSSKAVRVACILLIALTLIFSYLNFRRPQKRMSPSLLPLLNVVPVASWKDETGESNDGGTFSHDGKKVAFSIKRDGYRNISIKQIIGEEPIQITEGFWNDWTPIWSFDDEHIAIISDRGDQTAIWVIPSLGGTPRHLVTIDSGGIKPFLRYWSKDGNRLYFELRSNLYLYDLKSESLSQITDFNPAELPVKHFNVSRDETQIAYTDSKNGQVDIWVMPIRGGEPKQMITNDKAVESSLVWHPDDERIIYSANHEGTYQIFATYLDGSDPMRLTSGVSDHWVTCVSASGNAICEVMSEQESTLWWGKTDEGHEIELSTAGGLVLWPEVSPEGNAIAFQVANARNKAVRSSIFLRPTTPTGKQIQLAQNGFDINWSPDGSRISFLRFHENSINLWSVKPTGDDERQITTGGVRFGGYVIFPCERSESSDYSWSPDSKAIAYCSNKGGKQDIWVVSADGAGDRQVSDNLYPNFLLLCPLWSPDGRQIAYATEVIEETKDEMKSWRIWVIENGQTRSVFESKSVMRLLGWSRPDNSLLVAEATGETSPPGRAVNVRLIKVPISGKSAAALVQLESVYFSSMRLSPDGQHVAFVTESKERNVIATFATMGRNVKKVLGSSEPRFYFSSLNWSPDGRTIYYTKQTSRSLLNIITNFE